MLTTCGIWFVGTLSPRRHKNQTVLVDNQQKTLRMSETTLAKAHVQEESDSALRPRGLDNQALSRLFLYITT